MERTILLTGFRGSGLDGSADVLANPTGQVVAELDETEEVIGKLDQEYTGGWRVDGQLMDCELEERLDRLAMLMRIRRRMAVLALGMANTPGFRLERTALNLIDTTRVPGHRGGSRYQPIVTGPPYYGYINQTVPFDLIVRDLQNDGFEAEISDDAGTIGCNTVAFAQLHLYQQYRVPMLFMHVPFSEALARHYRKQTSQEKIIHSMPLERTKEGVLRVLRNLGSYALGSSGDDTDYGPRVKYRGRVLAMNEPIY